MAFCPAGPALAASGLLAHGAGASGGGALGAPATSAPEATALIAMVFLGFATAGFLAYVVRDLLAELAPEPPARAVRIAMAGPVGYVLGFLLVLAGLFVATEPVAGIALTDAGLAVIVASGVPMGVGLWLAWRSG